jgi:acyl-CoA synthetase (AMP-forming)/AMP-acid ligase II
LSVLDLVALVDASLAAAGDRVVVVDADGATTASRLRERVRRLTSGLASYGVGAGTRVAARQRNGVDAVAMFLAVLARGGVWAGINPKLGAREQQRLLQRLDPQLTVTDDGARLSDAAVPALSPGAVAAAADPHAPVAECAPVDPYAPAAIAFTSGTSAAPKGVVHSAHNIALAALALTHHGGRPRGPLGTALPLMVLNVMTVGPLTVLLSGRTSVLIPSTDPQLLAEWVERHEVTELGVPPTIVHDLLAATADRPSALRSLSWVETGGAACTEALRAAYQATTGRTLLRAYGLTEAPGTVLASDAGREPPPGSSGRPLAHVRVVIRDADGAEVATGQPGQICVTAATSGPFAGLYRPMLGHWQDGRVVPTVGAELRTGDIGVAHDGGDVTVIGRSGSLIVRGGANVSPAEVETVLCAHGSVAVAAVFGVPDERLGETVAAAVVPATTELPSLQELRQHVASELSWSKAPDYIVVVDDLPRSAAGKVVTNDLRDAVVGIRTTPERQLIDLRRHRG